MLVQPPDRRPYLLGIGRRGCRPENETSPATGAGLVRGGGVQFLGSMAPPVCPSPVLVGLVLGHDYGDCSGAACTDHE